MIQKSFKNNKKCLYIIPTPIGNIDDITVRALEIFSTLDLLLCEDTRNTSNLLNKFKIRIPLKSYHEHNKDYFEKELDKIFTSCNKVGLVSDAGFPLISDPGHELVRYADKNNINFIVIPGATSFLLPLARSGFSLSNFYYNGFLLGSDAAKNKRLKEIMSFSKTSVLFESKHKIIKTVSEISKIDPFRKICIARELTKLNEEYILDEAKNVLDILVNGEIRGEFVIVIEGAVEEKVDFENIVEIFLQLNLSNKDISRTISKLYNVSRNDVYKYLMEKK